MFTKKRILVVALSAALAACGGGDKASQGDLDALRAQVAAQQQTIDGLKTSSAQQVSDLQAKLTAQQATLDDLLAKMATNTATQQSQWQEILALKATIEDQQKFIKQLQAGAEKVDVTGPVLKNFAVSKTDVLMPDTLTLSVQAEDTGSGMMKVEFYEAGKEAPVAVASAPYYGGGVSLAALQGSDSSRPYASYVVSLPLNALDNGTHSYYVRAYDMAVTAAGTVASNITSNADAAVRVNVTIPDNGLEAAGNMKADFSVENLSVTNLKADPHHDGVFMVLNSYGWSGGKLLKLDYGKKTASLLDSGQAQTFDVAFHPKRADTLFRTTDSAIQSSADGGLTWTTTATRYGYTGVPGQVAYSARYLTFTPSGSKLFASSYGNGSYYPYGYGEPVTFSVNDGVTWTASAYSSYSYGESTSSVMVGGGDEQVLYTSTASRVLRSSDGGRSFMAVGNLPASSSTYLPIVVSADPFNANVVLALVQSYTSSVGQQSKLYRSTDGGASWTAVQLPTTPLGQSLFGDSVSNSLTSVVHSSHVKGLVYLPVFVGRNNAMVLRSKDGGVSWELLPFFDPSAKGYDYQGSVGWLTTAKPDADGAVPLFMPSSANGFNRYLDRTALK